MIFFNKICLFGKTDKMKTTSCKGVMASIVMSVIIGFQFYFIKGLTKIFSENLLSFTALRFFIALIGIIFFIPKSAFKKAFNKKMILLSLIAPFCNIMAQTYGVALCDVTTVGYVSSIGPAITVIAGWLVLKEKISKSQVFSLALVILGTVLISAKGGSSSVIGFGSLLILSALICRSIYAVLSKKQSENYSFLELSFAQILWGFVWFVIAALIFEGFSFAENFGNFLSEIMFFDILSLFYVSVCSITIVYILNNYSISKISIRLSGIMSNLTFVITLISGVVLLGEKTTLPALLGASFIIIGICLNKSQ